MSSDIKIFLPFFLILLSFVFFSYILLREVKKNSSIFEISFAILYIFSLSIFFLYGYETHKNQYFTAIDPVDDECYTPFGGKHILSLLFYYVLYHVAIFLVWAKTKQLAPLTFVISLAFLGIGFILNLVTIIQLSKHVTEDMNVFDSQGHILILLLNPILNSIIGLLLLLKVVKTNISILENKVYANFILQKINLFLYHQKNLALWGILLMLPLLIVITMILILFGQDADSLSKVFTDTATWRFSQQLHPPVLDHKGHYLCTVAAKGNPSLVKPIRIGKRNGQPIIVNRQLLIANAFEEMIQDYFPKFHVFIRRNYDKYGYNLSQKIQSEFGSNVTYILMKPVEWIFLISLYLGCKHPEEKIKKQYS